MTYGRVFESKFVNALVPDAQAKPVALPFLPASQWLAIMRWFKTYHRGLWVGGTATLTESHLVFAPNALNAKLHTDDTRFALPLRDIAEVTVENGFITNIIAVATAERAYRIRCFGAREFAARIRQAAQPASGPEPD